MPCSVREFIQLLDLAGIVRCRKVVFRSNITEMAGPKSKERMLIREWIISEINKGEIPGLVWRVLEETFQIPWRHGSSRAYEDRDAELFRRWAIHTNRYGSHDPKRWKANFRCALNSRTDIERVPAQDAKGVRVYKLLPTVARRGRRSRTSITRNQNVMHVRNEMPPSLSPSLSNDSFPSSSEDAMEDVPSVVLEHDAESVSDSDQWLDDINEIIRDDVNDDLSNTNHDHTYVSSLTMTHQSPSQSPIQCVPGSILEGTTEMMEFCSLNECKQVSLTDMQPVHLLTVGALPSSPSLPSSPETQYVNIQEFVADADPVLTGGFPYTPEYQDFSTRQVQADPEPVAQEGYSSEDSNSPDMDQTLVYFEFENL